VSATVLIRGDTLAERVSEIEVKGDLSIDWWYPGIDKPNHLYVGMTHVRSADGIRIAYDFDRDGWAISQDATGNDDWHEVAFVQAWALRQDMQQ
jgi:hypothetical protein